ncbi:dethiobiotin synthase [Microaerobacter geothermalis]|uniref:dethiobiotin synthase n=1 Tax=Microaerobacter geothermalis TaxID=674972 RepID=UPI001F3A93C1|nr:dethiobiotin synthase [Microaerobacter geothermalis]MCF6094288.1 dethiobiotin synthase [Microaerobacter geothermalis]
MRKGLFVTGTDTDVGKTFVTSAIAGALRKMGIDVGVFKPMQSGTRREDPNSDAFILKATSEDSSPLEDIAPFTFEEPLAPYVAAKRQGLDISLEEVLQVWRRREKEHEFFLVEGAGGLAVPLGRSYLVSDVAKAIGLPLLIVARPDLGTVNHTLLTIQFAKSMGLEIVGVIVNGLMEEQQSVAEQTNPALIEEFSGIPVLGVIPRVYQKDFEWIIRMLCDHISMNKILL